MTDFILMMGSVFAIIIFCYITWSRLDNKNKIKQETQNLYFLNLSLTVLRSNADYNFNDTNYLIKSGVVPESLIPKGLQTLKNLWEGDVLITSKIDIKNNQNLYKIQYNKVPSKACEEIIINVQNMFKEIDILSTQETKINLTNSQENKKLDEKLAKSFCKASSENTIFFIN